VRRKKNRSIKFPTRVSHKYNTRSHSVSAEGVVDSYDVKLTLRTRYSIITTYAMTRIPRNDVIYNFAHNNIIIIVARAGSSEMCGSSPIRPPAAARRCDEELNYRGDAPMPRTDRATARARRTPRNANRERPRGTDCLENASCLVVLVDSSLRRWKIFVYYYYYYSDDGRVRACSSVIKYIIKYSPVAATAALFLLCCCRRSHVNRGRTGACACARV